MVDDNEEDSKSVQKKRVRELEPGMKLAREVRSDQGHRLFEKGDQLDEEKIRKLEDWKIRLVHVYEEK